MIRNRCKLMRTNRGVRRTTDVLIVLHRDGVLSVYSEKEVQVRFKSSVSGAWVVADYGDLGPRWNRLCWPHATEKGPGKVAETDVDFERRHFLETGN